MLVEPVTLTDGSVSLEPLRLCHAPALGEAARDGELWRLEVTSVPEPGAERAYIESALATEDRVPFAVRDAAGTVVGSTSYHDILPLLRRVEIGYTWYALRAQRTHVNTACKLLLLDHAFQTLRCATVGWRTDIDNHASQRAIERLGARRDGVIRGTKLRRDGSLADTVMYSLVAEEWPAAREALVGRLRGSAEYARPRLRNGQ